MAMFAFDIPIDIQEYLTTPIFIVSASQLEKTNTKFNYAIGTCHLIQNPPGSPISAANYLAPIGRASNYLEKQKNKKLEWKQWQVKILEQPKFGSVETSDKNTIYHPMKNYFGTDKATFLVQIDDYKIKTVYYFKVMTEIAGTDGYDAYEDKKNCPKGLMWEISPSASNPVSLDVSYKYLLKYLYV